MKILITGGKGMLGRDLQVELASLGELLPVDIEECDITDRKQTNRVLSEYGPDVVVHAAAFTRVDDCETEREIAERVNVQGTVNVAETCAAIGAAMVYFSSDYVFDGRSGRMYTEDDPPHALSEYGRSKLAGENRVRAIIPDGFLIIRTSWLFGLHGGNFVRTILKMAKASNSLRIVNDQIGSPTYTRDLASAVRTLITNGARGIYNVTNTGSASWYAFARYFTRHVTPPVELEPVTTEQYPRPAPRPAFSVLSPDKLKRDFQFALPHWQDAVDRYLAEMESFENRTTRRIQ